MWQRKQTIFLGITAFFMVLMIFFPIWRNVTADSEQMLFPLHYTVKIGESKTPTYFPYAICAILAIGAATMAILEIGKFENRMLQIKMGALNSILMAGTLAAAVYFATRMMRTSGMAGEYGLALYMPAAAMVSNMIANRFIRKDEKLVRDADRLR